MHRFAAAGLLAVLSLALSAPTALAQHGEGLWGEVDDRVITNFGFALIVFFPLFIFFMSLGQHLLDRRKEGRKRAEKARQERADLRGGW
jgi:putative copper export protein